MLNNMQSARLTPLFLFLILGGTCLQACGASQQQIMVQKEINELNTELRDMRRNMSTMENLVEDLQSQLALAEEKQRHSVRAIAKKRPHSETQQPRPQLQIVRLGPNGAETPTSPGDMPSFESRVDTGYAPKAPSGPVVFQTLDSDGKVVRVRPSEFRDNLDTPDQAPQSTVQAPELREKQNYNVAYADFRAGRVQKAELGFKDFVQSFPQSHLTDNALYWWGECRYHRKDYVGALRLFQRILEEHPSSNKVPDGMVKMGLSLISLGQRDEGLQILRQVSEVYPETPSARVARSRHQKISGARPQ